MWEPAVTENFSSRRPSHRLTDFKTSHALLRAALILAGREVRKRFGRLNPAVLGGRMRFQNGGRSTWPRCRSGTRITTSAAFTKSSRVTPAMPVVISGRVWDVRKLLETVVNSYGPPLSGKISEWQVEAMSDDFSNLMVTTGAQSLIFDLANGCTVSRSGGGAPAIVLPNPDGPVLRSRGPVNDALIQELLNKGWRICSEKRRPNHAN
jgi:hypothetical protein